MKREDAHRLGGIADFKMIGIGKPTKRRSVMTSLVPMVMS